jgi:hypothetical protein
MGEHYNVKRRDIIKRLTLYEAFERYEEAEKARIAEQERIAALALKGEKLNRRADPDL